MIHSPAKLIAVAFIAVATLSGYAFRSSQNESNSVKSNKMAVASFEELVIQIPLLTEKNHMTIAQSIVANPGVEFKGYCSEYSVLMFVVDRNVQPDNNFMDETMHLQELQFFYKYDASIERLSEDCGIAVNSEENPE